MRAFITGVTGFAGSHLGEHLLSCGDTVLGCSRHGAWPDATPSCLANEVSLFKWDHAAGAGTEIEQRVSAFAPDVVYHLAAISVPAECGQVEATSQATAVNVAGTREVLHLCQCLKPQPKLIFISSCYVYGPVSPDSAIVDEDAPLKPRRGYGKTKLAAEQEIMQAVRQHQTFAVIARAFQHTGPRQSPRMIVPDWARQLTSPGDEPIRAICLDSYLDLTDVRDTVRAYRAVALDGKSGTVYNVGSGVCRRSGEILEIMQGCSGSQRQVVELEPGRRQHPIADVTRLKRATGWKPEIPLEQTITDTLDHWRQRRRAT